MNWKFWKRNKKVEEEKKKIDIRFCYYCKKVLNETEHHSCTHCHRLFEDRMKQAQWNVILQQGKNRKKKEPIIREKVQFT